MSKIAHHEPDGNRWTAIDKHLVVTTGQPSKFAVQGIAARDTKAIGMARIEHDGLLEFDLFDISAAIALSMRAVKSLRNQ